MLNPKKSKEQTVVKKQKHKNNTLNHYTQYVDMNRVISAQLIELYRL